MEHIGNRLLALRKSKDLSRGELAKASNLSVSYICYIEKGQKQPTRDALEKLAAGLKVELHVLTGEVTKQEDYTWFMRLPEYIQTFIKEEAALPYLKVAAVGYWTKMDPAEMMKDLLPVDFMVNPPQASSTFGRNFELMFKVYLEYLVDQQSKLTQQGPDNECSH